MTYVVLWGDLLVSFLAVLLTGGLTSGFLLYSFLPVITAALLFSERLALIAAALAAGIMAFAHIALSQWTGGFAWIMESNILLWLIVYSMVGFLVAISVFRTNLNIRQRIQDTAVGEERQRMRRELHDGIAQALSYLSLKTETVDKQLKEGRYATVAAGLDEVRQVVDETYKSVRDSLDTLRVEAGTAPLTQVLEEYLKQFEARHGIKTALGVSNPPPSLTQATELELLRIVQEALANVRKHSQATQVWVTLVDGHQGLEMTVKDNGRGMDTVPVAAENGSVVGHHGMSIMRERAEALGGTFSLVTSPGSGVEARIFVPRRTGQGVRWRR
ncbi:MAG: sensor histidine kinase [Chloroflexi bacterium]|nr:sensor histidine kinase [Chloroflexota bacterium]